MCTAGRSCRSAGPASRWRWMCWRPRGRAGQAGSSSRPNSTTRRPGSSDCAPRWPSRPWHGTCKGENRLGTRSRPVPPRGDAHVRARLLELVAHARAEGGWSLPSPAATSAPRSRAGVALARPPPRVDYPALTVCGVRLWFRKHHRVSAELDYIRLRMQYVRHDG